MKLKIMIILMITFFLVACANAPIPEDQKTAYTGTGKVSSVILRENNKQEFGVEIEGQGFIVVMVKEPKDIFPGQRVKVIRDRGGYGEVTVL